MNNGDMGVQMPHFHDLQQIEREDAFSDIAESPAREILTPCEPSSQQQ